MKQTDKWKPTGQETPLPAFQNIFFDLGGVLYNLNTRQSLRIFHSFGLPVPEEILNDTNPFNASPDGHPLFQLIHRLDIGEIDGPTFIRTIHSQCRKEITQQQVLSAYNDMIEVPVSRLQLLMKLRQRYRLYLVSNIGDLHWQKACELADQLGYPLEKCFDRCFCSYQMKVAKPDPAFFQQAIRASGVRTGETLYIDDSIVNCRVGEEVGLLAYPIKANQLEQHIPTLFGSL